MTHLNQDELVLFYYDESDLGGDRSHLDKCAECQAELTRLARVLDQVTPVDIPEPDEGYEGRVWDRLQWRLRGEKKRQSSFARVAAVAAIVIIAFISGLMWNRRETTPAIQTASTGTQSSTATPVSNTAAQQQQSRDRILLVVVGDHFDDSERMLLEITNLTPKADTDITVERERAEELLASNRLYRRTALDRGEEQVATLLDELEPVLLEIAHAPDTMTADEVRTIQKRVETKALVFKLRVVRADVRATATPHLNQPNV